jgi:hypothetical protein
MVLLTVALVMAALAATSALPAMAEEKSCDEVVAKLQEAPDLKDIDEGEMVALVKENPQCFTLETLTPELVEQLKATADGFFTPELVEQLKATADELIGPDEGNEE